MSAPDDVSVPARRSRGQLVYDRGPAGQAAFEAAAARLREQDSWLNPRTGERELNADLVLEGGGVKGIGLAGAICVLAEVGYRFPRSAGTSAGAIAAVLTAAVQRSGRDMAVLRDYLNDIEYPRFTHTGPVRHAFERFGGRLAEACELMFRTGLYDGDYLDIWLRPRLAELGVITWADLAIAAADDPEMSLPEAQRYRAAVFVSDLTRGTLARLPWDYADYYGTAPGAQEVVASVRASMSIPFFFVPVRHASRASQVRLPDGNPICWPGGMVTWADGGMLMNFPISAFDRVDGKPPRWPTIGIRLSAEPGPQPADKPVRNSVSEARRCLQTMMGEWDRYHVDQATADRTIFISNLGISATQFRLGKDQQEALFRSGAQAATEFVIRWARAGHVPRSG